MDEHTQIDGDPIVVQAYRTLIREQILKYGWTLLSEEALLEQVLAAEPPAADPAALARLVKNQFVIALYEACRPAAEAERREQGYRELSRFLYRAAYYRWPELAEDVVQRSLLLVYEKFAQCRSPLTFLAFALNVLRWAYQKECAPATAPLSLDEQVAEPVAQDDPALDLESRERERALQTALQALAEKARQTIVLKYLRGWSDDMIAQQLDLSIGNVRVTRHRALQQLRQDPALQAYLREGLDL